MLFGTVWGYLHESVEQRAPGIVGSASRSPLEPRLLAVFYHSHSPSTLLKR